MVLNKKLIANAKLHVSLHDSCSILDSLWNNDHRTLHHTQNHLIQEHYLEVFFAQMYKFLVEKYIFTIFVYELFKVKMKNCK